MKKLLILVVVAALVGIVMSKKHDDDAVVSEGGAGVASEPMATSDPPPAQSPGAAELAIIMTSPSEPEASGSAPAAETPEPAAEQPKVIMGSWIAETPPPAAPKPPVSLTQSTPPAPARPAVEVRAPAVGPAQPLSEEFAMQVERAGRLLAAGQRVEARALLSKLYVTSRGEAAVKLRALLDRINEELVFTPRCIEGAVIHVVERGEVGERIAKKYGVSWGMIKRINRMQSSNLSVGQRLKIIPGPATVLACKSEFRLALFMNGAFIKEYPIGIGRDHLTPSGAYEVDSMLVEPRWYTPGGGYIEYGQPGHQLGDRWVGFQDEPGANGLGIHGTNDEASIGTKCSNGCLRMRNADVIELYDFMSIGTRVQIIE